MYVDDLQLLGISMISKLISTAFVGAWGEAPGAGGWRQGLCGLELAGTTCLSNGWREGLVLEATEPKTGGCGL